MTIKEEKLKELSKKISENKREMTKEEREFILSIRGSKKLRKRLLIIFCSIINLIIILGIAALSILGDGLEGKILYPGGFVIMGLVINYNLIWANKIYNSISSKRTVLVTEAVFIKISASTHGSRTYVYVKECGSMVRISLINTVNTYKFEKGDIILIVENVIYPSPKGTFSSKV